MSFSLVLMKNIYLSIGLIYAGSMIIFLLLVVVSLTVSSKIRLLKNEVTLRSLWSTRYDFNNLSC